MASAAIESLRAERDVLLDIAAQLTDADWGSESGCAGWSVQDLVAHLGSLYWLVVDPSVLPDTADLPTEVAQDRAVESRRSWTSDRVIDDYATVSAKALDALEELETQDFELPLGDLGTYHASKLVNAYAFDHYTHIRADLFPPRGPLQGPPPPSDALRLGPTLDWIEVAAPQQNADLLAEISGAIEVTVAGTVARSFSIGTGERVVAVQCAPHDLVLWATQRASLDDLDVRATGSVDAVSAVRRLHVF
jgi:uncharacterized protein (TIGR03083 family)